jgi:hypothetical protein
MYFLSFCRLIDSDWRSAEALAQSLPMDVPEV